MQTICLNVSQVAGCLMFKHKLEVSRCGRKPLLTQSSAGTGGLHALWSEGYQTQFSKLTLPACISSAKCRFY